jgi:hypothetical protein
MFKFSKEKDVVLTKDHLILPYPFHCRYPKEVKIREIPLSDIHLVADVEKEKEQILVFLSNNKVWVNVLNLRYPYYDKSIVSNSQFGILLGFRIGKDLFYLSLPKQAFRGENNLASFLTLVSQDLKISDDDLRALSREANIKDLDKKPEPPKHWDNVSNNYWTYINVDSHWILGFANFILFVFSQILLLLLIGMVFFLIAIPFGAIYYALSGSIELFYFIVISITVFPTLIAWGYSLYALLKVKNTGGQWHYSSIKTDKINRNRMVKNISKFLEENGYDRKMKYYWVIGNRWNIFSLRKQGIKLKMVFNKGYQGNLFDFYIGPIQTRTETEVTDLKERFSGWSSKNIRPVVGKFPIHRSEMVLGDAKLK